MATSTSNSSNPVDRLVTWLEPYFTTKAPFQLPDDVQAWIANWAWLVSLVFGIIAVPGVLALLGFGAVVSTVAVSVGIYVGPVYWLSMLFLVVQMVLLFAAVPGLKRKSYRSGWMLAYYAVLFSAASSGIMILIGNFGSLIGAVLSFAIGSYILFQVKDRFKDGGAKKPAENFSARR